MRVARLLPLLAAVRSVVQAALDNSQQTALPAALPAALPMPTRSSQQTDRYDPADSIWLNFSGVIDCNTCGAVLIVLKAVALFGDRVFIRSLRRICKLGKVEPELCDGYAEREGPALARLTRDLLIYGRTQRLLCGAIFGLCEIPKVEPLNPKFPDKKPNHGRPPPSGKKPLKVVHFSDIHVDQHYKVGSNAECSKPVCCHDYAPGRGNTSSATAGRFGHHNCDSPVELEQSMYAAIKEAVPDIAFALFTGDIVDHTTWKTTKESNINDIHDAMSIMDSHLKTVYSTIGSHDVSPANLIPSNKKAQKGRDVKWLYELLAGHWVKWTGNETAQEILKNGAYSVKYPNGKLRIISLNTNLYSRLNFEAYHSNMERDPNGQFKWLVKQLAAAEKAGERAYIIGHMPMGNTDTFYDASYTFDQIVDRYTDTIAAMFFGHTHLDQFELHYSDYVDRTYADARAISYIAPSLTPMSGNPSFRVYDVDPDTFSILDVTQYIANMSNPDYNTTGPVWTKYYTAKAAYGAQLRPPMTDPSVELTPAWWHNVTEVLQVDHIEFSNYIARKTRGWKPQECGAKCQKKELCKLRGGRAQDNCVFKKFGGPDKRNQIGNNTHDDDGASTGIMALRRLATNKVVLGVKEIFEELREEAGAKSFDPEQGWLY